MIISVLRDHHEIGILILDHPAWNESIARRPDLNLDCGPNGIKEVVDLVPGLITDVLNIADAYVCLSANATPNHRSYVSATGIQFWSFPRQSTVL